MLRIKPYSKLILYPHKPVEVRVSCISLSPSASNKQVQERDTCPPPQPPRPPPKDDRLFWGTMAIIFAAGSFAVYAKHTPEVRDWITIHAPWFDDMIAVAYQENMTYKEYLQSRFDEFMTYFEPDRPPKPPKPCPKGTTLPGIGVTDAADGGAGDKPKNADKPPKDSKAVKDKEPCDTLEAPSLTRDVCELEPCVRDLGETAINNYGTARDACIYYNKLVSDCMKDFCLKTLKSLRAAMVERKDLVQRHVADGDAASIKLDDIQRYIDCGVRGPKESVENLKKMLKEFQDRVKATKIEYTWENDKSQVIDAQWVKVEEMVDLYTGENEILFPSVKYAQCKPHLEGDGDLLIHHTLRYTQKLKADLDEAIVGMTDRVNRGIATLSQCEQVVKARNSLIQSAFSKRKYELDAEFRKKYDDLRAKNDKILKTSLKKQQERHEEVMAIRLKQKEEEMTIKLQKLVEETVAAEKKVFKLQLAEMRHKLKIVEDKLNERLKAERETRRSQELYAAGVSLLAATKQGIPLVKVDKQIKALEKAAGDEDKLVLTVLKSIPDSVREEGIVPESVLRERYHGMEDTALKVALVEQDGALLPIYFLSYLQSILLFIKLAGIPQEDIDKPIKENTDDLDTFDLLQRARYWIERGNLAAALRYVSALEGASKAAAAQWYSAARSHLETRQAAEAVLAHAAALGLQYI